MVGGRTATQPAQPGQPVPLKPGSPLNRDKVKQKNVSVVARVTAKCSHSLDVRATKVKLN